VRAESKPHAELYNNAVRNLIQWRARRQHARECQAIGKRRMIHHIDFAVTDFDRSREFYVQALLPLGLTAVMDREHGDGRRLTGFGELPDPVFWIRNGHPVNGRLHVAFCADSRAAVDAFHAAALIAGGRDKGPPGLRPRYAEHYYAAYILDPDGHNIEAVCRLEPTKDGSAVSNGEPSIAK